MFTRYLNFKSLLIGIFGSLVLVLIVISIIWGLSLEDKRQEIITVDYENGKLSVDLRNANFKRVMEEIYKKAVVEISVDPAVNREREITISFTGLALDEGIKRIIQPDSWLMTFKGTPPVLKTVNVLPQGYKGTLQKKEDTNYFEDKDLGIRFRYPKSWGEVSQHKEIKKIYTYIIGDEAGNRFSFAANIQGESMEIDGEVSFFPDKFDSLPSWIAYYEKEIIEESYPPLPNFLGSQRIVRDELEYVRYFNINSENFLAEAGATREEASPARLELRYIIAGNKFDSLKMNPTISIELPVKIADSYSEIKEAAEEVIQQIEGGEFFDEGVLAQIRELDRVVESVEFIE